MRADGVVDRTGWDARVPAPRSFALRAALAAALALSTWVLGVAPARAATGDELWRSSWDAPAAAQVGDVRILLDGTGALYQAASLTTAGRSRIVVRRLTAAGVVRWTRTYAPRGRSVSVAAVAPGPAGSLVLAGASSGSRGSDWLVLKYTRAGRVAWVRVVDFSGRSGDRARAVATTPAGRAYVTGTGVARGRNANAVTRAYASDGRLLWSRSYDGPRHRADTAAAVALDGVGNVYVVGTERLSATESSLLLVRYSPAGRRAWVQHVGTGSSLAGGDDVAVLGETVAVAGGQRGAAGEDALAAAFGRDGSPRWSRLAGLPSAARFVAVDVAENSDVAVVGHSMSGPASMAQAVTLAYDITGAVIYGPSTVQGLSGDTRFLDVAVTPAGWMAAAGFYGTAAGTRAMVFIRDGLGPAHSTLVPLTSAGAGDRAESVILTSDAVYAGAVLEGDLALLKLARF